MSLIFNRGFVKINIMVSSLTTVARTVIPDGGRSTPDLQLDFKPNDNELKSIRGIAQRIIDLIWRRPEKMSPHLQLIGEGDFQGIFVHPEADELRYRVSISSGLDTEPLIVYEGNEPPRDVDALSELITKGIPNLHRLEQQEALAKNPK